MKKELSGIVKSRAELQKLVANTAASKVIQFIKDRAIDPVFDRDQTLQTIQSWPTPLKITAEWVLHLLSGAARTLPDPQNPVYSMLKESLTESMTQMGIKVNEISGGAQRKIIEEAIPSVRTEIVGQIRRDEKLQHLLRSVLGNAYDWDQVLQEANNNINKINESITNFRDGIRKHRETRKSRGSRRFV
ncbi:MAG TPA: hypothetical protein VFK07_01695 [Candidatus Paceibacterota bacterium]|nr:hypothetical protein [Candidatus Paceibacterota bacterium]